MEEVSKNSAVEKAVTGPIPAEFAASGWLAKSAEVGDSPQVSSVPWGLVGRSRRLTMLLYDFAYTPGVKPNGDRLREAEALVRELRAHKLHEAADALATSSTQF